MEEFELEPGEKIMKSVRRHPFVIVLPAIGFSLLGIFPLTLPLILAATGSGTTQAADALAQIITLANPWVRFAIGLWWLALWMGILNAFTRYYLTVWIITNTRIVDIHQDGLFNRRVSSTLLARVQDVTTDVNGFFNTMLGFGTLLVQTAGSMDELKMESIIGPEHLRDFIMNEVAALHAGTSESSL